MILYQGKIYDNQKQDFFISKLRDDAYKTLSKQEYLDVNLVIDACDVLYSRVMNHYYDDIVYPLLNMMNIPIDMLDTYAKCFSKEGLQRKLEIELGDLLNGELDLDDNNTRKMYPLGILFHIPAGNMDLLPAYSVIEGLLTGNINVLKLPSDDNGLSIKLLSELISIEPKLTEYIYVFDVPSTETETIKKLSDMCDATIVYGGDEVNRAARQFVDIHSSLIVWGHKISFSYVDENVQDVELVALAKSICQTNQLLCSSSQGIYVNTQSKEVLLNIAKRFCDILANESEKSKTMPLTMKAKNTLLAYNEKLEGNEDNTFLKNGTSVYVKEDNNLTISQMFRNVWVKTLLKDDILKVLKPNKNVLQTVSVSENMDDFDDIVQKLSISGVNRITKLGDNSRMIPGEAHDGEYPLRRYVRIVERIKSDESK